ncbi:CpsD/CapB family tyrosine-protein kinase [Thalassovita taeanensis]|uniref:Chromosome partitioning ATPase, Mrp family, contains Fe-S cluster n=1 Tax=Thalassovita taeanensis TaxID=657014 RepID=A0A1H9C241_9RHOB|nr:CpsD/CapB family tyrosine-protein kinase [Thalassovita taeanensis]SEP95027.1 Chromosome partitioning ATPase, Mrp family, contains Fe-S cluster [Thalassovita taeanensis]
MAEHVVRRRGQKRLGREDKTKLLERVARYSDEIEKQEKAVRAAMVSSERAPTVAAVPSAPEVKQVDIWDMLPTVPVDEALLERNLVITASRNDPAHAAFDVLRARLVQTLTENGWKRVGITSPTRDCGKTFVAANLAITLSRYENSRTVLLDLDMRNPSVANTLGAHNVGSIGDYLRAVTSTRDQFRRIGKNTLKIGGSLAIAMNDRIEPYAAELLQDPVTRERLHQMELELSPDIILFDLPPALAQDDVIAFRQNLDGVLVVTDGRKTSAAEVREVMRRLGTDLPLLGVILNKAEDASDSDYGY